MQSIPSPRHPTRFENRERRFRKLVCGGIVAYVDPLYAETLGGSGLLEPGGLDLAIAGGSAPRDERRSRGLSVALDLPGHSERLHLRFFHHGGWLARGLGQQLFGLTRPLNELKVNAALEMAGAPVPKPIVVIGERTAGPFFRSAFGTLHVEHSMNGAELLRSALRPRNSSRQEGQEEMEGRALDAAAAGGAALRRLHDAGARHPDLHLGNLLFRVEDRQIVAMVIDLDRAELGPPRRPRGRMVELMRLHRSVVKSGLEKAVSARVCARFFDAYTDGDRSLRRALLAHLPAERLRLALHRLAYS